MVIGRIANLVTECVKMIHDANITIAEREDIDFVVGHLPKNTRALCSRVGNNKYKITLSNRIVNDAVADLKCTVIHELLHTTRLRDGHRYSWLACANKMNYKYNLNIKRLHDLSKEEIEERKAKRKLEAKHIIECTECGHRYHYMRKTRYMDNLDKCRCSQCPAKGSLVRVK